MDRSEAGAGIEQLFRERQQHSPVERNQETAYTYKAYGQLTSVKSPADLTTTNIYYASGDSVNRLSSVIDLEISRTNSYTYSDDLVFSHTDPRNLVTTNYWTSFNG
jgi:hypothetical protein